MAKLRVFLVDDHVVLRDGLTALINAQPDMEVIGYASDGQSAVQYVQASRPDVVVMDVSLPLLNGAQATEELLKHMPGTRVVVLTRHSEAAYVRRLLQAGALGYVLKQSAAEELISAVRTVLRGGTYLDSALTERAVDSFIQTNIRKSDTVEVELSEREADVVRLIAHGYSNKEVANELGLSVKTVDTYKARAMEKLGLFSRTSLVRYALQQGWFEDT